jgi:dihydropteroate synthase
MPDPVPSSDLPATTDAPDLMALVAGRQRPLVMGVVNVTPDSFSDGGALGSIEAAVAHALALEAAGAQVLDVGGESTRPGAGEVPVADELERVVPVIEALRARTGAVISVDTRKPEVARAAVAAGASVWNDVSALTFDPASLATAAGLQVPVVLMHAQGTPQTMQTAPRYGDVTGEVLGFLVARIGACVRAGLGRERLLVDPGIGFGKTLEHNLVLLRELRRFAALGVPVLVGASRKSFIGKVDPAAGEPLDRLGGSLAAALWAGQAGAAIVRVHDVRETAQALMLWAAIGEAG